MCKKAKLQETEKEDIKNSVFKNESASAMSLKRFFHCLPGRSGCFILLKIKKSMSKKGTEVDYMCFRLKMTQTE